MIANNIFDMIGATPLLKANNIMEKYELKANLYLKLERFNPTGSSKDRLAYGIIKDALDKNEINKDTIIIEPTSGNTGISLSAICSYLKMKCKIVMPSNMSKERIDLIKAYGAEVILTDEKLGMSGSIALAKKLHEEINNSFIPSQFDNPAGTKAFYDTCGKEIANDLNNKIDYFIAGIGTGATFSGTGKYLKENCNTICIGVEPKNSNLLAGGISGIHKIQGIGANFIPKVLDRDLIDMVYDATDEESYYYCKDLVKTEGILCGISSGAALACAISLAKSDFNKNKNIVVILPDAGERYLSTGVFDD